MKNTLTLLTAFLFASRLVLLAADQPNIVIILADDLGYGDVHCLNPVRGKIATPNLDRLASQSMTFTDAHDVASVCTPSRYGLLTGRYAWRSRLHHGVLDGYVPPLIDADRLTVAGLLQQHGYYTACIGKWHLGFTIEGADKKDAESGAKHGKYMGAPLGAVTTNGPTTRGFDLFFGYHHAKFMKSVFENDRVTKLVEPVDLLPTLVQRAGQFIADHATADKPFFLYLPLSSPHVPIVPTKEWEGKSGLGDYGDFVMETDWAVGQVLAALDRAGMADNTLVIFSSDNGCSPMAGVGPEQLKALKAKGFKGAKGKTEKYEGLEAMGHYSSGEFRGHKSDIWDGGHRVPFFVRWPGKVKPGSQSSQLISLADFMATCAGLLDAKLPAYAGEDSVNLLPALLGTDQGPLREAIVYNSINGYFGIQQGSWKLELCPGSGGWGTPKDQTAKKEGLPPVQLYNMDRDIGEEHNLQAEHPEIVQRLSTLLEKYVKDGRSTPGPAEKNDSPVNIWNKGEPQVDDDNDN